MIRKLSATVAAGALMAAAPAMADEPNTTEPVNFDAEVEVQQIATLDVVRDTASMVVDNTQDTFQGQPSSDGSVFNAAQGKLAILKLSTNFTVDGVKIEFKAKTGFGPPDSGVKDDTFGVATNDDGEKLGVWPQMGALNENNGIIQGSDGILFHDGEGDTLTLRGDTRQDESGFEPGVHRIGVGVSTKWDRVKTPDGEPQFAEPGTYTINMTASIVPDV